MCCNGSPNHYSLLLMSKGKYGRDLLVCHIRIVFESYYIWGELWEKSGTFYRKPQKKNPLCQLFYALCHHGHQDQKSQIWWRGETEQRTRCSIHGNKWERNYSLSSWTPILARVIKMEFVKSEPFLCQGKDVPGQIEYGPAFFHQKTFMERIILRFFPHSILFIWSIYSGLSQMQEQLPSFVFVCLQFACGAHPPSF